MFTANYDIIKLCINHFTRRYFVFRFSIQSLNMADIRDILDIERVPSTEGLRDSILGISDKTKLKKNAPSNISKPPKRPEGMARELYALLCVDRKDAPPLLPTDTGIIPFLSD